MSALDATAAELAGAADAARRVALRDCDPAGALDLDLAPLILRLAQINREAPPDHPQWRRVVERDLPRLRARLTPTMREHLAVLDARAAEEAR